MTMPRPLVVAHRGSNIHEAEHTMAAYREAVHLGADALECDVRLTRDGHLVLVHDRRVDRTADGRGMVSALRLEELEELDFGHRKRLEADWDVRPARGWDEPLSDEQTRVVTLKRLLDLALSAPQRVQVHVETKHPTRYGALVERHLVGLLSEYGLDRPTSADEALVTIMSFSTVALRRARALAPRVPLVLLLDRLLPIRRDGRLPSWIKTAGVGIDVLRADPGYVSRAHAHGRRVHVWTVDRPEDLELVLSLGVDAVISNRPADVLRRLGRLRGGELGRNVPTPFGGPGPPVG